MLRRLRYQCGKPVGVWGQSLTRLMDAIKTTTRLMLSRQQSRALMRTVPEKIGHCRHEVQKGCKRVRSPQLVSVHIAYQTGTAIES